MSNSGLVLKLSVGLIAGWLAGKLVHGAGFELIFEVIIGVLGAFIGVGLLPRLGLQLGVPITTVLINATVGSLLLLLILTLARGRIRRKSSLRSGSPWFS
jgi:uncharacterized membrane protein YeaQ/YmgE (transglycosylase-associated protein family)